MSILASIQTWLYWRLEGAVYQRGQRSYSALFSPSTFAGPAKAVALIEDVAPEPLPLRVLAQILAASPPLNSADTPLDEVKQLAAVRQWVRAANATAYQALQARSGSDHSLTLLVLLMVGQQVTIAHLGNSRAYLWREGQVQRLTLDHTRAQVLVSTGKINADEELSHPARTNLLRTLGQQASVEADVQMLKPVGTGERPQRVTTLELEPGDALLLCSAAIGETLPESAMAQLLRGVSPLGAARRLGRYVRRRGATHAHVLVIPYQPAFYLRLQQLGRLLFWPLCLFVLLTFLTRAGVWATLANRLPVEWGETTATPIQPGAAPTFTPNASAASPSPTLLAVPVTPTPVARGASAGSSLSLAPTVTLAPARSIPTLPPPTVSLITPLSSPTPTGVATSLPATPPPSAAPAITPLAPSSGANGSGAVTFRWAATVALTTDQAYELIFWKTGQDPLTAGFGLGQPTTATSKTENLVGLAQLPELQGKLEPGEYLWGVLLVQNNPYRRLRFLGGGSRFTYTGQPAEKARSGPVECNGSACD